MFTILSRLKKRWIRFKSARHWAQQTRLSETRQVITRWWESPAIIQHINTTVCSQPLADLHAGFHARIKTLAPGGGFKRGISIGCGTGLKELQLIRMNTVQHFDLFEINQLAMEKGRIKYADEGFSKHVSFHTEDPFSMDPEIDYDLIYWNNSLHHMLDVDAALHWSLKHLQPGGILAMDDFVGPTRFQWTETNLLAATLARSLMTDSQLVHPGTGVQLSRQIERPNPRDLAYEDPTEAADSSSILPAISRYFPDAEVILTGGCIYHLALNDVIGHLEAEEHSDFLQSMLELDNWLVRQGQTHYAVALARKPF